MDTYKYEEDQRAIDTSNMEMLERLFRDVVDDLLKKPINPTVIAFALQEAIIHVATESRKYDGSRASQVLDVVVGNISALAIRLSRIESEVDAKKCNKLERLICQSQTDGTS